MALPKIDIRQLLLCLRAGKPAAFERFYSGTVRQVAAHLRKLGLQQQQDLEDVIQETYVEAYKSYHALSDDQAALAWLLTIARRQWSRHRDRRQRQPLSVCQLPYPRSGSDDTGTRQLADPRHVPADTAYDARQLCHSVRQLIAEQPDPKRQQALTMYYLLEHSLPEITAATGVGASTLTTWLARFRTTVKERLGATQATPALVPQTRRTLP